MLRWSAARPARHTGVYYGGIVSKGCKMIYITRYVMFLIARQGSAAHGGGRAGRAAAVGPLGRAAGRQREDLCCRENSRKKGVALQ